ncbi:MAG: PEP-CTERM sorting domain-containing protein [Pseudomonadota bacterium]
MTRPARTPSGLFTLLLCLTAAGGTQADSMFPGTLSLNTTGFADSTYTGAPDDYHIGLGGQMVTYDFGPYMVVNRPGAVDFNIYEVDYGSAEFGLMEVYVSANGIDFINVSASETSLVRIAGDEVHSSNNFGRSYDLGSLDQIRYIKIDGDGSGAAGGNSGFDLDAIGAHQVVAVPEPGTYALLLAGLGLVGLATRQRRAKP